MTTTAQSIRRDYYSTPLPIVLDDLNRASGGQSVFFIYDELEDYSITCHLDCRTLREAIQEAIGFYPINVREKNGNYYVECVYKTPQNIIGDVVDEHGQPLPYSSVAFYSPSDSSLIASGIANQAGHFVIPAPVENLIARVSHIGYKTLYRTTNNRNMGTIRLHSQTERLPAVYVDKEGETTPKSLSKVQKYIRQVSSQVWNMQLPEFDIHEVPSEYHGAKAIILAEYDSVGYAYDAWSNTQTHLHITRYYVTSDEIIDRLQLLASNEDDHYTRFDRRATGLRMVQTEAAKRGEDGSIIDIFTYHYLRGDSTVLLPAAAKPDLHYPNLRFRQTTTARTHYTLYHWSDSISTIVVDKAKGLKGINKITTICRPQPTSERPVATTYVANDNRGLIVSNAKRPSVARLLQVKKETSIYPKTSKYVVISSQDFIPYDAWKLNKTAAIDSLRIDPYQKAYLLYSVWLSQAEQMITNNTSDIHLPQLFIASLIKNKIPFRIAYTTQEGREDIDQLITSRGVASFVVLGNGDFFFPETHTPAKQIPSRFKGRKALLDDFRTYFFLPE